MSTQPTNSPPVGQHDADTSAAVPDTSSTAAAHVPSDVSSGPRATIEDVAAAARVSVATVSRAMRGLPNVAAATRQRVVDVAQSLNYRPDPAASRLAAGKTKTITVGVPSLNGWYFSTVVAGAEAVCNEAGYEFQVIGVGSHDARDRLLDDRYHLERRTDGLILVDVEPSDEQASALARRGVSLTTIGARIVGCPSVQIDDEHVGRLAADHLIGFGHRDLGVISGLDDDPMNFAVPMARRSGFFGGAAAHGITLGDEHVRNGNFGVDGGRVATAELLDAPRPPTAIFAMSDEMAFGALMELEHRGLRPGVDVSIIGVDDHEFARVVKLTTIRQTIAEHGAVAARLLIEAMTVRATDAGVDYVPPAHQPTVELVQRSTTGPV
jgi:LacI family transcriptional regulator, repressor for deo operon, udp, cdd, tsx, nupC, and nupG